MSILEVSGAIRTRHNMPECVGRALKVDNLRSMVTSARKGYVITEIEGTQLRSIIASVDDYLMNLAIAEEICSLSSH